MQAGVIDEGAVCNSGYGDGGKEYDIQDWFHENLSVQVENTGYYILDEDTIDEFNKAFPDDAFDAEEPTDDSALFYWEWY